MQADDITAAQEPRPCHRHVKPNMRDAAARQRVHRGLEVARVPDAEEDPRRELRVPVVVGADRARHEREDLRERVGRLDVNVQCRVTVLRLAARGCDRGVLRSGESSGRTRIKSSIVSSNVGMGCRGSFLVRRCCIPLGPYHFCSLIRPAQKYVNRLRTIRC